MEASSASENNAYIHAEHELMSRGAGFCILPSRKLIRVVGDDRASFLHGMCSNDIRNARPGQIVPALFLTEHAHVIADFFAWIEEDSILLDIDDAGWDRARPHLEKLLVADDVEFEEQGEIAVIAVEGSRSADAVAAVSKDAATLPPFRWVRASDLLIGRMQRFAPNGFTILAARAKADSIMEKVGTEFRPVSYAAMNILRVENGIALIGVDTTDKTIALEARLNPAISLDKGCYVGQETLERATARGGLKKKLFGLHLEVSRAVDVCAAVRLDGKEVGRVTSLVDSPRLGTIGLAILNHSAWELGRRVVITDSRGDVAASVCDIPFKEN